MKNYVSQAFGADLRSLAALRIGTASLILLDLLQRSTDLVAHYTDFGVVPRGLVMTHSSSRWYISVHFLSGIWEVQALLFILAGLAALALLVGYRTRLAGVISWLLFVSLCNRDPFVLQGGDMLLRLVLFWGMFLPWGAVYSADSAWCDDETSQPNWQYFSWGTAAYALQILIMYWMTVLLKSGSQWWSEGSAVYYTLNIDYLVTPIGKLLVGAPYGALRLATWSEAIFEIVGPLLLLLPVRRGWIRITSVVCFVLLHLLFLATLLIGIFPVISIIAMLFFLPGTFWDWLRNKRNPPPQTNIKIYYDQDCGFCLRTVRLIKKLFLLPEIKIAGAQSVPEIAAAMRQRNSWVVLDPGGSRHFGYDAIVVVSAASPVFRFLTAILNLGIVRWLGERIYRYVATHRPIVGRVLPANSSGNPKLLQWLSRIANGAAGALILYVLVLNLATVPALGLSMSDNVRSVGNILGLDQLWNMFAPFPAKDDGWYVIPGKLRNGAAVDLFRAGRSVDYTKPNYASLEYKNHRWRKYMELLRKREYLQPVYGRYLCRLWNQSHRSGETLEELEIIYVLEWTQPAAEYSPIEKQSVYKFKCAV